MTDKEDEEYIDCLKDAVDAIKDAQSKLDLGYYRCSKCGSLRYNTWVDKLASNALSISLSNLEKLLPARKGGAK